MYELKIQQFTGPIEKLLELIEGKKMEITDLALSEVTADFIRYLESLKSNGALPESDFRRILADFIVVASRLLLIKSKTLMPFMKLTDEEESEINELKQRLAVYQNFKPAIFLFKKLYENGSFSLSRPYLSGANSVFYPPENFNADSLKKSFAEILSVFDEIIIESRKINAPTIKLEEKIEEIVRHLEKNISRFSLVIKEKPRSEIIVLFLALLHLLREQIIKAEQDDLGEIIINKYGNE